MAVKDEVNNQDTNNTEFSDNGTDNNSQLGVSKGAFDLMTQQDLSAQKIQDELLAAIKRGDRVRVEELVDRGADVNKPDASGTNAIMNAVENNDANISRDFLQQKANGNTNYDPAYDPNLTGVVTDPALAAAAPLVPGLTVPGAVTASDALAVGLTADEALALGDYGLAAQLEQDADMANEEREQNEGSGSTMDWDGDMTYAASAYSNNDNFGWQSDDYANLGQTTPYDDPYDDEDGGMFSADNNEADYDNGFGDSGDYWDEPPPPVDYSAMDMDMGVDENAQLAATLAAMPSDMPAITVIGPDGTPMNPQPTGATPTTTASATDPTATTPATTDPTATTPAAPATMTASATDPTAPAATDPTTATPATTTASATTPSTTSPATTTPGAPAQSFASSFMSNGGGLLVGAALTSMALKDATTLASMTQTNPGLGTGGLGATALTAPTNSSFFDMSAPVGNNSVWNTQFFNPAAVTASLAAPAAAAAPAAPTVPPTNPYYRPAAGGMSMGA